MKLKKHIAIILTALMLISSIPFSVFANDTEPDGGAVPPTSNEMEPQGGDNSGDDNSGEATPNGSIRVRVYFVEAGTDTALSNPEEYYADWGESVDMAAKYAWSFKNMHYKCVNPEAGVCDHVYSDMGITLYYKRYYDVEVKYLDKETKKPLRDSKVEEVFAGDSINFQQEAEQACPGWTLVQGTTSIDSVNENKTIELLYDPNPDTVVKVTLNLVDETGRHITTKVYDVEPRKDLNETIQVYSYEPKPVSYKAVVTNITDTVVIKKQTFKITIHFKEAGTGKMLKEDVIETVEFGSDFNYMDRAVDAIEGGTLAESPRQFFGITENKELILRYNLALYDVTVHFVDAVTGDTLRKDEVVKVKHGSNFDYTKKAATAVPGATLAEGSVTKIDNVKEDTKITLMYDVNEENSDTHSVDVRFVYGNGEDEVELAEAAHYEVKHGETVDVTCPTVEGYYPPEQKFTTDPITEDRELTVEYSKNQYMVTVHYVDKNGKKLADDAMEQVEYMDGIEIDNPYIEGYKPADGADAISISNVTEDTEVDVIYIAVSNGDDKPGKKSNSPDTGDNDPLGLMLMLMVASGAGLVALKKKED